MDFSGESIYNLLPSQQSIETQGAHGHHTRRSAVGQDGTRYKSKHNSLLPPSYSTFGVRGSVVHVANASGTNLLPAHHQGITQPKGAAMAADGGAYALSKSSVAKSDAGEVRSRSMSHSLEKGKGYIASSNAPTRTRKPPVPTREDKPILGLKSDKNFVVSNAVDSILSVPRNAAVSYDKNAAPAGGSLSNALAKPMYGKVPPYLKRIQSEIMSQKRELQAIAQDGGEFQENHAVLPGNGRLRKLSTQEVSELQTGLRNKWNECNKAFQTLSFSMETLSQLRRRDELEQEMKVLEDALKRFNKQFIFVYDDTQPQR